MSTLSPAFESLITSRNSYLSILNEIWSCVKNRAKSCNRTLPNEKPANIGGEEGNKREKKGMLLECMHHFFSIYREEI